MRQLLNTLFIKEMLIYRHPAYNQLVQAKARFCLHLQIKHLHA